MTFSIAEVATILNALRYYGEHVPEHEHEQLLIAKIGDRLKADRLAMTARRDFEPPIDWEKHGLPAILEK